MNKAFLAIGFCLGLPGVAFAQQKSAKDQIVGAWTLVSVTSEMDDGQKGRTFRSVAKGHDYFLKRQLFLALSVARGDSEDCGQ